MDGQFDAAGDVMTGMLAARAVEPHAGDRAGGAHTGICLNCGTALIGDFCHACGQTGHIHSTLSSIGHDLLHGVFHFEGKIWRTLPMLVLHPGALTRRYIAGERARFVSPLALFLFFVFLMFAVIHAIGGEFDGEGLNPATGKQTVAQFDQSIAQTQQQLVRAQASLAVAKTPAQRSEAQNEVTSLRASIASATRLRDLVTGGPDGDHAVTMANIKTGWAPLDRGIVKASANPGLALYKLQSSAYKYSWALIPISTPFVALLFLWRRQYRLYDHAIFVIYSLDFMTLLVVVLTAAYEIGLPGVSLAALIAPPLHLYKQLRGAYRLGRGSALWRTGALLIFAFLALCLFMALLLGLGLMG